MSEESTFRLPTPLDGERMLNIRVRPHAKRTVIKETMSDGSIKIDIAAPAEGGRANAELIRFLSEECGVPRSCVEILSGQTSRKKVVRISAAATSP